MAEMASYSFLRPHSLIQRTLLNANSVGGFMLGIEYKGIIFPLSVLNIKTGTSALSETLERKHLPFLPPLTGFSSPNERFI